MQTPPATQGRSRPAWRPSSSSAIPDRGNGESASPRPPLDSASLTHQDVAEKLERQREQISALNARAQRLLGFAALTLGVLALEVVCLAGLIVARLYLG